MKNYACKWFFPEGFLELITSWESNKIIYPQNIDLKDKCSGINRCFILGCGPSILKEDLSVLKGELCISVANFFVHPLIHEINPAYHVFAASHKPITKEQFAAWLRDADKYLPEKTGVLLEKRDMHIIENNGLFASRKVHPYMYGGHLPIEFTKQIPPVQSVSNLALYLAIYLGVKRIYLLGIDHTEFKDKVRGHFYEETENKLYCLGPTDVKDEDLGITFETMANLWKTYRTLRDYYAPNVKIINLSQDSALDLFVRDKLKAVVQK